MTLNERVKAWSEHVGMIHEGLPAKQVQKIAEEVIETALELTPYLYDKMYASKAEEKKIKKEIGDILFSTQVLCNMLGFEPDECLKMACDKNDKRKDSGRMINGNFVKAEDL
jgi:phosphoribosyl-ATP pyrophosphohydrolase